MDEEEKKREQIEGSMTVREAYKGAGLQGSNLLGARHSGSHL